MRRTLQFVLPVVILVFFSGMIFWIFANKEEPQTRRFAAAIPEVSVRSLEPENFQITLLSQGSVRARTASSLIPEVRGRIVRVAPNFQEGAFFEEGEVLLEIDDRDYRTELKVAQAALAQVELDYAQEKARFDQASRDWERLNPEREATQLTLREPQLRQARAAFESAQARVETAELNLERTQTRAPYAGRVLRKNVDVGQVVSTGTEMAEIYAVDIAEVRLPLTASQTSHLALPDIYRGSNPSLANGPKVTLRSQVSATQHSWTGRIVRSEGAVDERTRQLFVVAQIEDPYGSSVAGRPPLKVGTFVQAEIEGVTLENVFVVPRILYRENSYVLVVDGEDYLERRAVGVVWENDENIIVGSGLRAGDLLCLTDVPYALEGLQVAKTLESAEGLSVAAVEEELPERRRAPRPDAGPSYPDQVMEVLGAKLPADLKDELLAAKTSMDPRQIRPVMGKVAAWAEANGEAMPPNPRGDGRPRG